MLECIHRALGTCDTRQDLVCRWQGPNPGWGSNRDRVLDVSLGKTGICAQNYFVTNVWYRSTMHKVSCCIWHKMHICVCVCVCVSINRFHSYTLFDADKLGVREPRKVVVFSSLTLARSSFASKDKRKLIRTVEILCLMTADHPAKVIIIFLYRL